MRSHRRVFLSCTLAALASFPTINLAHAADYPSHPIELIDPYPPGGSTDIVARQLQKVIGEELGQPILVLAKPGAAGNIGAVYVSRSEDAHRLLMATNALMAINPHTYQNTGFDPFTDFVPIALVSTAALAVAVRSDAGIENLPQLIDRAKQNPKGITYGTPGMGSPQHLIVERLSSLTQAPAQAIHYNGIAPAIVDLMGGHIDFVVSTYASLKPHLSGNRIKVIAVAEKDRLEIAPDVATIAESYPEFGMSNSWFGIFAPKTIAAKDAERLEETFREAIAEEATQEVMRSLALTPGDGTSESLSQALRKDYDSLGKQIKELKISIQ